MDKKDLAEIKTVITEVVQTELKTNEICYLGISKEDAAHFTGMVSDIGGGKISTGIEAIRGNHTWIKKLRERGDKISTSFILLLLGLLVSSGIYAIWEGIKSKIMGGP